MKTKVVKLPEIDIDKYRGYVVLTVDEKIYATKKPENVARMMEEIHKKHHKWPTINHIPKAGTLIVWSLHGRNF